MLKHFFYSVYSFVRITPSRDEAPQHIANIILSILFTFDTIFFIDIINQNFNLNISFHDSTLGNIVIYIFYLVIIHFLINDKNKFQVIINHFEGKSDKLKLFSHILFLLWVLFTIFIGRLA